MATSNSLNSPTIKFITNNMHKRHRQNKFVISGELFKEKNNHNQQRRAKQSDQIKRTQSFEAIDIECNKRYNQSRTLLDADFKTNILAIKGPNGSIRGHKDCVKKNIDSLLTTIVKKNRADDDCDLCVAYVTSLGVIRKTYEDCRLLKSILYQNLIYYEERDIYLNHEFRLELKERCGKNITIPAVFLNGQFIGGVEIIGQLNETGEIARLMSSFKMKSAQLNICGCCGNAKFIPCVACHGSTKSKIQHYNGDSIKLRCSKCTDGLIKCPLCLENMRQIRHERSVACQ